MLGKHNEMKEQFGLEVQLHTDKEYAIEDESLRVFLFRAVQELLFNAAKHSGVNSTRVVLSAADRQFTIRVSDPGRGFNPETINDPNANNGIGLLSMRERSKAMGGQPVNREQPGQGLLLYPLCSFYGQQRQAGGKNRNNRPGFQRFKVTRGAASAAPQA